jgi:hypothetical protein
MWTSSLPVASAGLYPGGIASANEAVPAKPLLRGVLHQALSRCHSSLERS